MDLSSIETLDTTELARWLLNAAEKVCDRDGRRLMQVALYVARWHDKGPPDLGHTYEVSVYGPGGALGGDRVASGRGETLQHALRDALRKLATAPQVREDATDE